MLTGLDWTKKLFWVCFLLRKSFVKLLFRLEPLSSELKPNPAPFHPNIFPRWEWIRVRPLHDLIARFKFGLNWSFWGFQSRPFFKTDWKKLLESEKRGHCTLATYIIAPLKQLKRQFPEHQILQVIKYDCALSNSHNTSYRKFVAVDPGPVFFKAAQIGELSS